MTELYWRVRNFVRYDALGYLALGFYYLTLGALALIPILVAALAIVTLIKLS